MHLIMCRMFASLLKQHGPLDPNDDVVKKQLQKCSTDAQIVICDAGGVAKFLRQSLQFAVVDGYVCLASDAGKARQIVRSHRQALNQNPPQPPAKLNPPPHISAKANVFPPDAVPLPAAATFMSTYRSLAGMDIPSTSRVIPGLSQEPVSTWSTASAFLSQPSASDGMLRDNSISSAIKQTAVCEASSYNESEIQQINGGSRTACDAWTTVSKVTKSSAGVRDTVITTTPHSIGELDDFSELFVRENTAAADKRTLNEGKTSAISKAAAPSAVSNADHEAYYNQFKNILESSESDSSDEEPSADDSVDISTSSDSESDPGDTDLHEPVPAQPSTDLAELGSRPIDDLDSFDAEVAEVCSPQPKRQSSSSALSVTAAEFVPLTFAASQPASVMAAVSSSPKVSAASSPKLTIVANRGSSDSRPSSTAAATSNKRVQTDEVWNMELQQMKHSHAAEMAGLQQQLSYVRNQLQVSAAVSKIALISVNTAAS